MRSGGAASRQRCRSKRMIRVIRDMYWRIAGAGDSCVNSAAPNRPPRGATGRAATATCAGEVVAVELNAARVAGAGMSGSPRCRCGSGLRGASAASERSTGACSGAAVRPGADRKQRSPGPRRTAAAPGMDRCMPLAMTAVVRSSAPGAACTRPMRPKPSVRPDRFEATAQDPRVLPRAARRSLG